MGALRPIMYGCRRFIAASLFASLQAVSAAETNASASAPDMRPKLEPLSAAQVEQCVPSDTRPSARQETLLVAVTVSPDGKADNLRFPANVEPWQEASARCIMGLLEFSPAMHDGVPVAADVSVPIDFRLPSAPRIVPPRMHHEKPEVFTDCYARSARRAGAEGRVEVELTVGPDGRVRDYQLPAGIERWQEVTARCVIERLSFEPATRDGVPFAAKLRFPLNFSIEGFDPLTLARLAASDDELDAAVRSCYPGDRQEIASPKYRVTVNVRGWPSQVMLVESSGDKKLDAAGACVLKKVRYEPARRGERPVMSTLLVPVTLRPSRPN